MHINRPIQPVLEQLAEQNIVGGYRLEQDYPELANTLLICATETKTELDLQRYTTSLSESLQ
jgi:glycine dehydrogenase subunit 1